MHQSLTRAESPQRWEAALRRAIAAGVEPLQVAGGDRWVVTSSSRLSVVYETSTTACTCAAALAGDDVCIHRAAIRFVLGTLAPDPEPEPEPEPTVRPLAKQYLVARPHAA